MSEQEIVKHSKKVYKIWKAPGHSLKEKIQEFIIEIIVIVLAVSISIWLHNSSEKRHEHAEEKEFLTGLSTDLKNDITEMKGDTLSYGKIERFFNYLIDNRNKPLDTSIVNKENAKTLYSTTGLVPNVSRFEALKFSGKMGIIENKELLDEILNLYEEKIPNLIANTDFITRFKTGEFSNYLDSKLITNAIKENRLGEILQKDDVLINYLQRIVNFIPAIRESYNNVFKQNAKLIALIDKEQE